MESMVFEAFTPGVAKIAQLAGAEFIMYDMEHSGLSMEILEHARRDLSRADIVPMTRVPRGEYHLLAPALDVGARAS